MGCHSHKLDPFPELRRGNTGIGEETQIPSSIMMMSVWLTWQGPVVSYAGL